jgi:hypothetical protein
MQAETFKWTTLLAFVTHIGEGRATVPLNREQQFCPISQSPSNQS